MSAHAHAFIVAYRTGSSLSSSLFFRPAYAPVLPSHEEEPDRVYCGAWESAKLYCAVAPFSARRDDDFRSSWFRQVEQEFRENFFARRNERSLVLDSVVEEEMVERKRNELA